MRYPANLAVPLPADAPERMAKVAQSLGLRRAEWMRQVLLRELAVADAMLDTRSDGSRR